MAFLRVDPGDSDAVAASTEILNAAMDVDDPSSPRQLTEIEAGYLRYGWDLEPAERYLYLPRGEDRPVGVLDLDLPTRDNRHLVWAGLTVRPQCRRRGHGTALMVEALRRARAAGRTTVWVGVAADDTESRKFVARFGFRSASSDARRRQLLGEVDQVAVQRLYDTAREAAADYRVERLTPPIDDPVLAELVDVTAAINDAPMGELTYEDEVFDLARLRDMQTARAGTGDNMYRILARHRTTGQAAAHTVTVVHPLRPEFAFQGDTAVARTHRGHKLGLLVKIEMMRWLATAEPRIRTVETFNNTANSFMINVNEALGYRLSRLYDLHEVTVEPDAALHGSTCHHAVATRS